MSEHTIAVEHDEDFEAATPHGPENVVVTPLTPPDGVSTDDPEQAAWIAERAAIRVGNDKVTVVTEYPPEENPRGEPVPVAKSASTKKPAEKAAS
jgi:hypothetical protein